MELDFSGRCNLQDSVGMHVSFLQATGPIGRRIAIPMTVSTTRSTPRASRNEIELGTRIDRDESWMRTRTRGGEEEEEPLKRRPHTEAWLRATGRARTGGKKRKERTEKGKKRLSKEPPQLFWMYSLSGMTSKEAEVSDIEGDDRYDD